MKITIIRTAKPAFAWKNQYNSKEYDLAEAEYAESGICGSEESSDNARLPKKKLSSSGRPVYIGPEPYCRETAEALFESLIPYEPVPSSSNADHDQSPKEYGRSAKGRSVLIVTDLLQEVPLQSAFDTDRKLSPGTWRRKAWWQRVTGRSGRQPESVEESRARASRLIDTLCTEGQNCILISDERMISVLVRELKRRGFHIRRGGLFRVDHLERIIATDNEPHCGGCMHDCPLSNPGCMIGKDKAAKLHRH